MQSLQLNKFILILILCSLILNLGNSQSKIGIIDAEAIFKNSVEHTLLENHFNEVKDSLEKIQKVWINTLERKISRYWNICSTNKAYLDEELEILKTEENAFIKFSNFAKDSINLYYTDCKEIIKTSLVEKLKDENILLIEKEYLLYYEKNLDVTEDFILKLKLKNDKIDNFSLIEILDKVGKKYELNDKLKYQHLKFIEKN